MRHYYKTKDGKGYLSLKTISKDPELIEITEVEFRSADIANVPTPTPEELEKDNIRKEIMALKKELASTDYQALKYFEGWITSSEYAPIKMQRQTLRDRINELEAKLN